MDELFRNSHEFRRLYNCSFYNVSDVPFAQRQNIVEGMVFLTMGVVEEVGGFALEIKKKNLLNLSLMKQYLINKWLKIIKNKKTKMN
jgi:ABC-type long-subunit fatty acid transport system fused permease/ATPase subunit